MSEFHRVDVAGCEDMMMVIEGHNNRIVEWTHTPGDYDSYDMNWTLDNGVEWCVEGKDRRVNFKTGEEQYTTTYSTVMLNYEKYFNLLDNYCSTGEMPGYVADYTDGIIFYSLLKLPYEEIRDCVNEALEYKERTGKEKWNKWCGWFNIEKQTLNPGNKKRQLRLLLPIPNENNKYGKILKRNVKQ